MSPPSKKLSGAQNLKRKRIKQAETEKSANLLSKFLKVEKLSNPLSPEIKSQQAIEDPFEKSSDHKDIEQQIQQKLATPGTSSASQNITEEFVSDISLSSSFREKRIDDISEWPSIIDSATKDEILIRGPVSNEINNENYPKNSDGRHFSNSHFKKVMPNGEVFKRRWLVYSKSADKIYCFCCRVLNTNPNSNLGKEGFDDWRHLSTRLKTHETSLDHRRAMNSWIEASIRLKSFSGIDKHLQKQIENEKSRWVAVLERMMSIVFFLAGNNLAFRGSSEKLYTPNNGNFLGLVQLLGKFDNVMMEHLRRIVNKETNVHYFSKRIQNELITLLGSEVRNNIVNMVKSAKYFSIIMDCTADVSHVEQLSLTLRFVEVNEEEVDVRECFLAYKPVSDSSGAGLTGLFLDTIVQEFDLDMNDCRGQGYDNGANMVGVNKGVQTRILNLYPRAFFNPCGCHSLNLVIADAAKSSVKSVSLFGFLQKLFVLFSGSTKRWEVISKHLEGLSLKKVCETRWESRVSSLAAVRFNYTSVRDALQNLHEETNDSVTASESLSLIQNMDQFEFIVTMVAWYDILFQVNIVSKAMQSETMDLPNASLLLKNCSEFVKEYRRSFSSTIVTAKEIASLAEINPVFKSVRSRRKKRLFEYEAIDETPTDPEELYKINVFYPMVDTIENTLATRFQQLSSFNDTWSFLYDIKIIPEKSMLEKACADLQIALTDGENCDISGQELIEELISLKPLLKDLQSGEPIKVLRLIKKNDWQDVFPNVWTALRILLTVPVTVAKGERSFSKLKLIKTYLRSTMCQERLSDLAILSIENAISKKLNYSDLITKFASAKARKVSI